MTILVTLFLYCRVTKFSESNYTLKFVTVAKHQHNPESSVSWSLDKNLSFNVVVYKFSKSFFPWFSYSVQNSRKCLKVSNSFFFF